MSEHDVLEARVAALEAMLAERTETLAAFTHALMKEMNQTGTRLLALAQALAEQNLVTLGAIESRARSLEAQAREGVEFSPEFRDFRQ